MTEKPLWTERDHEVAVERMAAEEKKDGRVKRDREALGKAGLLNDVVQAKAERNFRREDLILLIHAELSKKHLLDDKEKLCCFLTACTGFLDPPELRKSQALVGDSSVGKDNAIKAVLSHFPREDWLFLTNATQATMEDDITKFRILAYSEMNANREDGANRHLVEVLKQVTEGGLSSLKKDAASGYRTTRHSRQEQKTVFFSTTESEVDEELNTRFVTTAIRSRPHKTRAVNNNTLQWFAGRANPEKEVSWVAAGIRSLGYDRVMVPFAPLLQDRIGGKEVFDSSDSRSMRDVKRLMAYTCAVAWLYQKQRKVQDDFIIAEPVDFLIAVSLVSDFFNRVYQQAADIRLAEIVNFVRQYQKEFGVDKVSRKIIQTELGIAHHKTVKSRIKLVTQQGLLEWVENINNCPHYRACQKPVKSPLMHVTLGEFVEFFQGEEYKKKCLACHSEPVILTKMQSDLLKKLDFAAHLEENDMLKMTGCQNNPESPKETEVIHYHCSVCDNTPCTEYNTRGEPLCAECVEVFKSNESRTIFIK